jgi:hypothetical protein
MGRGAAVTVVGLAAIVAAACGGGTAAAKVDPATLLREAKATIDVSHSAHFTLSSQGATGTGINLIRGEGDIVRPDGIEGSFAVSLNGFQADVKVVADNGVFEVLLPFQTKYNRASPAAYGLTDPAQLLDPEHGLSNLLIIGAGARMTGQERVGGELLDTVTATVPGASVPVLPDSNPKTPVTVVSAIDPGSHQLRQMTLTGPFTGRALTTYVVTLTNYGEAVKITLPPT